MTDQCDGLTVGASCYCDMRIGNVFYLIYNITVALIHSKANVRATWRNIDIAIAPVSSLPYAMSNIVGKVLN